MDAFLHRSEARGHVQHEWLNTKHSFSFGSWHDPRYMGFGPLRVINDDHIAAHRGFGTHAHDNMEILTCVLSGTISHRDSMGNEGHIQAGEWQLMSAGSGIQHSEMNQGDQAVHLLQIWLYPNIANATPTYQQIQCDPQQSPNQWHIIAGPNENAHMHLRQDAEIKASFLNTEQQLIIQPRYALNYIHLIQGKIQINDQILQTGDAIGFEGEGQIKALEESQMIWFDMVR